MFPSFTGSSRRPRNVDLSGKKKNPFATSIQGGTQQALQSAQQEREARQRQRKELAAAKTFQRLWRGHQSRTKSRRAWREQWDAAYYNKPTGRLPASDSLVCHALYVAFATPAIEGDVDRFLWLCHNAPRGSNAPQDEHSGSWSIVQKKELAFALGVVKDLAKSESKCPTVLRDLLDIILSIITSDLRALLAQPTMFYEALFAAYNKFQDTHNSILNLISTSLQHANESTYRALVRTTMTKPQRPQLVDLLARSSDLGLLIRAADACADEVAGEVRRSLWLLGNLTRLIQRSSNAPSHTVSTRVLNSQATISLLGKLLAAVAGNIDAEAEPLNMTDEHFDAAVLAIGFDKTPLTKNLKQSLAALVDESTIRRVFAESDDAANINSTGLATYVLTLLRVFYKHSDDIRMWLYLGPQSQGPTQASRSPIAICWSAARQSHVVGSIMKDARAAINAIAYRPTSIGAVDTSITDNWKVVLLFLELYTFNLKLMDDEEFLGTAVQDGSSRVNPLSLADIADLVTFLKHLGFAMYFYVRQISDAVNPPQQTSGKEALSRIFGVVPQNQEDDKDDTDQPITLSGLPGVSLEYIKTTVTGLVRAIYERDSRRQFLPKDHWLMTSEFDMTIFIKDVVSEEVIRRQIEGVDVEEANAITEEANNEYGNQRSFSFPHRRLQHAAEIQDRQERLRQASRRRHLQMVAPRIEILQHMPFVIPFDIRVQIFREFVTRDKEVRRKGFVDADLWRQRLFSSHSESDAHRMLSKHHATIRRKHEFVDSLGNFFDIGDGLKEPIQITFIDEFGMEEAGIDGGGVTKEFLTAAVADGFSSTSGLFQANDQHLLYPNPHAAHQLKFECDTKSVSEIDVEFNSQMQLMHTEYEYAGRLIGKCLYEGILVDISFTGFFLRQWALAGSGSIADQPHRANVNDLRDLDEDVYRNLLRLKNYQGNVEDLAITFSVSDRVTYKNGTTETIEHELIPGGNNKLVTNQNRLIYISRLARFRLQEQTWAQTQAFLRGLSCMISPSWLAMFNQTELQTLVGGSAKSIDIDDLRRNTIYSGLYDVGWDGKEHQTVEHFWNVMREFDNEDRGKVLKFVTSTPRAPLLGFGSLNPKFSIRDSGSTDDRFPTTSTCVNLLKLPRYSSQAVLKEKLLYAINSGAGFDLS